MNENIDKEKQKEIMDYNIARAALLSLISTGDITDTQKEQLDNALSVCDRNYDIILNKACNDAGIYDSDAVLNLSLASLNEAQSEILNKNYETEAKAWLKAYKIIEEEATKDKLSHDQKKSLSDALAILKRPIMKAAENDLCTSYEGGTEAYDKLSRQEKINVIQEHINHLINDIKKERKPQDKDKKETKVETPKQELKDKTSEKLLEEYTIYEELIANQKRLTDELLTLSGKKDEESIKRINEIASSLGEIKNNLSNYDLNVVNKFKNYYRLQKEFDTICNDIKAVERLSKKSKGKKVGMHSAEGRKRMIDAELVEDYKALIAQKNKIRSSVKKGNASLIGVTTMMAKSPVKNEEKIINNNVEYVLPKIVGYDDLSIEDKIKETEERLQRIFKTSTLPNQGKKIFVTYNGKKYSIPRKYQGVYKETLKELGSLNKALAEEKTGLKDIKPEDIKPKAEAYAKKIASSERIFQSEDDKKKFNALFGDCPPKKQEEIYKALFSKEAIDKRNALIEGLKKQEEKGQKQHVSPKSFITTISTEIKKKITGIGKKVKETYAVLNKKVNFKDGTFQKISGEKSKICDIPKEKLNFIKNKFNEIKERMELNKEIRKYSKYELFEMIKVLREENEALKNQQAKSKVLVKKLEGSGGYAAIGTVTIMGFLLLAVLIFTIVGKIVNH